MFIHRQIEQHTENDFYKGKIIVILGARQGGKSTLINLLSSCKTNDTLWLDGKKC